MRCQRMTAGGFLFAVLCFAPLQAFSDERVAAQVLPASTVVYAEIRQPRELMKTIYDHELTARFMALDQVRTATEKKEYLDFKAGVAVVESQMGLPWRRILDQALGGGIVVGVDAKTQGVVLMARAADESTHQKLVDKLLELAAADAKNKGNPGPVKSGEYRGIKAYEIDKAKLLVHGRWLVITNNNETAKQIVDNLLDKPEVSLASEAQFASARASVSDSASAWAYVNTKVLRDAGAAKELFKGQADNPLGELLVGGILSTLQKTPFVTMALEVSDEALRLSAKAPHDRGWAGDAREYFYGAEGKGAAPPRLMEQEAILSLSAYRDISAMWLRAGDLFSEKTNDELAKADSNLSTLFAGKDFGEDILGALRPQVQIVVARQDFPDGQPTPAIKLPSFGLVADLKDAARMQPELRRTFQSLIGFLNVIGAMNGQPQLDLNMETSEKSQLITASYLPDANAKDPLGLKINYNFSPSIAFAGDRFVVASTKNLAETLATAKAPSTPDGTEGAERVVNTDAVVQFKPLHAILADNRGQLVAQNMLSEGHTKEEAEKAVDVLLELVGWLQEMRLSLQTTPSELNVSFDVNLKGS